MGNLTEDIIIEILVRSSLKTIGRFRCISKSYCKLLDLKFLNTRRIHDRKFKGNQRKQRSDLTEDLIIEILVRSPLNTIGRFRCVSRSWYYKLLDFRLIHMSQRRQHIDNENFKLLVTKKESETHEYNVELISNEEDVINFLYPFKKEPYGCIRIVGSCNGLVCACYAGHFFYVWNPCTAEYKIILSILSNSSSSRGRYIGHRRSEKNIGYGFGYDPTTSDYKFVSILKHDRRDVSSLYQVEIYTLGTDSWKRYVSRIPYEISSKEPGVFLNGSFHWLVNSGTNQPRDLICVDMEDGVVSEMPQPKYADNFDYKFVNVIRDRLCLLCSVSNAEFEIWEMRDYGLRDSWSKVFKIDCQELMTMGIPSCDYIKGAVFLRNGTEMLLGVNKKGKAPYELEEVDVMKLHMKETRRQQNRIGYVYMKNIIEMEAYVESLVSVNSGRFVGDERRDLIYSAY